MFGFLIEITIFKGNIGAAEIVGSILISGSSFLVTMLKCSGVIKWVKNIDFYNDIILIFAIDLITISDALDLIINTYSYRLRINYQSRAISCM